MDYDGFIVTSRSAGETKSSGKRFWFRVAEQFFRRWPLYLLPVVVLIGAGVLQAKKSPVEYQSFSRLTVTSNPFVDAPSSGTNALSWETPSAAMARGINERLSTDAFAGEVAKSAGLQPAIDANLLTLAEVRRGVHAASSGNTLLRVVTTWGDPQTAYQLNQATIDGYVQYVLDAVSSDSQAAIAFYQDIADSATQKVDVAQQNLDAYVAALEPVPVGGELDTAKQLKLDSLNSKLQSAQKELDSAESEIQAAQLSVQTAQSAAGKVLKVIDSPELATSPESTSKHKVVTLALFTLLGLLIAAAALIVAALLDGTVRSASDVARSGLPVIATVPVVRDLSHWPGRRGAEPARARRHDLNGHRRPDVETAEQRARR